MDALRPRTVIRSGRERSGASTSSIRTFVAYPIGPSGPTAARNPGTRSGSAASAGGDTRPYTIDVSPCCTWPHCQDTPFQNPQL